VVSTQNISRVAAGTLFTVGGTCLTLASLLGAPSFWYIPCVCALIPLGFVWWFCRPSLAAALSVGPLVAAACLIRFLSDMWLAISLACLIAAVTFVLVALRNSRGWKLPASSLYYIFSHTIPTLINPHTPVRMLPIFIIFPVVFIPIACGT